MRKQCLEGGGLRRTAVLASGVPLMDGQRGSGQKDRVSPSVSPVAMAGGVLNPEPDRKFKPASILRP